MDKLFSLVTLLDAPNTKMKHKLFEVTIKWNDTEEQEDALVSVGEGFDEETDGECVFTFTPTEWKAVKAKVKQKGKANCGDFSILKV